MRARAPRSRHAWRRGSRRLVGKERSSRVGRRAMLSSRPLQLRKRPAPRLSLARTTLASLVADAVLAVVTVAAIPYLVRHLGAERYGIVRLAAPVAAVALGGGVLAALWSQAGADLLAASSMAVVILHGAERRPAAALAGEIRVLAAIGVPFAVAGVFAALLADVEKLAIGMARSVEDFTYYSVPFNATLRLSVFAVALASVLASRLSSLKAAGDVAGAVGLARRARRISVAAMTLVVAPVVAV